MKYLKNVSKSIGIMIALLLVFTLLVTTLNYFNWMGMKMVSIMEIIIPIFTLFVGGLCMGKKSTKKGWLEGVKLACIFLVILILFNYLGLQNKLELKNLIYYFILIASCVFGSMIGISRNPTCSTN